MIAYLSFLANLGRFRARPETLPSDTADIGRPVGEIFVPGSPTDPSTWEPRTSSDLFALVERWQRAKGVEPLSDEEAMRLAVEEQHATRGERGALR